MAIFPPYHGRHLFSCVTTYTAFFLLSHGPLFHLYPSWLSCHEHCLVCAPGPHLFKLNDISWALPVTIRHIYQLEMIFCTQTEPCQVHFIWCILQSPVWMHSWVENWINTTPKECSKMIWNTPTSFLVNPNDHLPVNYISWSITSHHFKCYFSNAYDVLELWYNKSGTLLYFSSSQLSPLVSYICIYDQLNQESTHPN